MYTVKYEAYINDFYRKDYSKTFSSLSSIENWIFNSMQQPWDGPMAMYFPKSEPSRIEFQPNYRGPDIWIHMIESDRGIEFSDGKHTSGQKHWSGEIQTWLDGCRKRQKTPKFNFVS